MKSFGHPPLLGGSKNLFYLEPNPLLAAVVKCINNGKSNLGKNIEIS
jgi:hypothetical protein